MSHIVSRSRHAYSCRWCDGGKLNEGGGRERKLRIDG